MNITSKRVWHGIAVGLCLLVLGITVGIRVANRPTVYTLDGEPLFQAESKETGAARLMTMLQGEHHITLEVAPGKTASLTSEDVFALVDPNKTEATRIVGLTDDFVMAVEDLVRTTDPNKNTAGSITLDGPVVAAEPPAGDQVDREQLAIDLARRALKPDDNDPIALSFTSSDELRKRFDATYETLVNLLAEPILVTLDNEPTEALSPAEIAALLSVAWPQNPALSISDASYETSRLYDPTGVPDFDFSDPSQLRYSTEKLPLAKDQVLDALAEAVSRDRVLTLASPERSLAVDDLHLVSRFTTYYSCCQDRVTNIQQIAKLVTGAVIPAGQELSVNTLVGERTEEKGFVPAGSILGGELVDSVGGGVSQFATTLYNAVYWAGLEDIHHQPHSWAFSRYPTGIEATISWPVPDLKFRNNTDHPVILRTTTTDTSVTAEIWGYNHGRIVSGDHKNGRTTTKTLAEGDDQARVVTSYTTPPFEELDSIPTLIYPDITVPRFSPKIASEGTPGKIVNVFRTITVGDREHTDLWRVVYKPIPTEVHVHPCDLSPEDRVHRFDKYDYSWVEC